jgi:ABC-type sugar transport system substrate-binding protein
VFNLFSNGCTRKRLFFLSSAFVPETDHQDTLDFFSLLTAKLAERLSASNYDIVLRVPKHNKSGIQQVDFLTQAINAMGCYDAIVIAPIETDALKGLLSSFMRSNPKYPVLTIDKSFESHFKAFDGNPPPSVVVDGEKGGSQAGRELRQYFASCGKRRPSVRVLQGLEGAEPRVKGFIKEFADLAGSVTMHNRLSFDMKSAKERIDSDLKNGEFCDAYFCTNDEMALGVREALTAFERAGGHWPEDRPPVIVGFDGIGAMRALIKSGDKHMYGTIDVRLDDQVTYLSNLINEVFHERKPFEEILSNPLKRATVVEPIFFGRSS